MWDSDMRSPALYAVICTGVLDAAMEPSEGGFPWPSALFSFIE